MVDFVVSMGNKLIHQVSFFGNHASRPTTCISVWPVSRLKIFNTFSNLSFNFLTYVGIILKMILAPMLKIATKKYIFLISKF